MTAVQASRRVALDVLVAVRTSDAYANLLLPGRLSEAGASGPDAAFATELTYGTLRTQGLLDRVIEEASGRGTDKIDPLVLDVLRLGVHQLIGMRVAPHAVVDESVQLVRSRGRTSAAGFVNAVLRNVTRSTPDDWRALAVSGMTGDARRAVEFSHPDWIIAAFRAALSADGVPEDLDEQLDALLAADNVAPVVSLVALPGLAHAGVLGDPGIVSPIGARSPGGDPGQLPLVASGRARVQDEGSQLAALALSRARPIRRGELWLDLCAGPGGKAALLGAEAALGGARLIANELVPARAGLVRTAVAPLTPRPEVVTGDGMRFAGERARFDRILLDAPCTGLGALRRRPEARWRKSPDDVADLVAIQTALLDAAVGSLAPGGLLAYVTCSPHPAETREIVAAALGRHPQLEALDTPAVLAGIATRDLELPAGTHTQLWPHRHGTDAMFIQLFTLHGAADSAQ